MSVNVVRRKSKFSFTDEELSVAAGKVSEAMLKLLPEPEGCTHEFSPGFERKMEKLFARERTMRKLHEVKRWAAAILLMVLIGGGTVLAVDTEARAAFLEWIRTVYHDKIVYHFFNELNDETLPVYELGWVPEGYEPVDVYRDDTLYSAVYQKGENVNNSFIYQYGYVHKGMVVELLGDLSEYEVKTIFLGDKTVELYIPADKSESSAVVWIDEQSELCFMVNACLEETVILHIIEHVNLSNTTN